AFLAFEGHRPAREVQRTNEAFPGGGQILFEQNGYIAWAYPDGTVRKIADGFDGAQLFPGSSGAADQLLAWKVTREDNDYFVMGTDGSDVRHVLAPGPEVSLPGGYGLPPGNVAV